MQRQQKEWKKLLVLELKKDARYVNVVKKFSIKFVINKQDLDIGNTS